MPRSKILGRCCGGLMVRYARDGTQLILQPTAACGDVRIIGCQEALATDLHWAQFHTHRQLRLAAPLVVAAFEALIAALHSGGLGQVAVLRRGATFEKQDEKKW